MLASPSDAMLATLRLAEIVAQLPDGDDYSSDYNRGTISTFSSVTNNYSLDEFEGVVRCYNGMCLFTRA